MRAIGGGETATAMPGGGGAGSSGASEDAAAASGSWRGSLASWVGGELRATANYLPNPVAEVFSQDRSFAFAWIPSDTAAAAAVTGDTAVASGSEGDVEHVNVGPAGGLRKTAALIRQVASPHRSAIFKLFYLIFFLFFQPRRSVPSAGGVFGWFAAHLHLRCPPRWRSEAPTHSKVGFFSPSPPQPPSSLPFCRFFSFICASPLSPCRLNAVDKATHSRKLIIDIQSML